MFLLLFAWLVPPYKVAGAHDPGCTLYVYRFAPLAESILQASHPVFDAGAVWFNTAILLAATALALRRWNNKIVLDSITTVALFYLAASVLFALILAVFVTIHSGHTLVCPEGVGD